MDICADDVIRIRYMEGNTVPDNKTRMVIGCYEANVKCSVENIKSQDEQRVDKLVITTVKIELTVNFNPYSLDIRDLKQDKRITTIGGIEKNNFNNCDSTNTGICYIKDNDSPIAVENFSLNHNECIYGLGERFLKLDKVGQTIDLNMKDALGVLSPRAYKNIPFYISGNGYGVFFNHSSLMTFWVGSTSACDVQVAIEDNFLDYYVFTGNIKEILKNYTTLTGKGELPPKWSFGYWQSKISYSSDEETLEIIEKMRELNIPCDVLHLDTHWFGENWYCDLEFDKERFGSPEVYIKRLSDMGIKLSLWQLPYIPEGSSLFENLKSVDGFVKDKNGKIYDSGICYVNEFKGTVGIVDYTNPKAVEVHKNAFRQLFKMGAKVIKTDFGEDAPLDGVYFDGTPGHQMHNLYPLLYNEAIYNVTKEATGDGIVWARSAWAGNQRYPLHWGGDNSPNFMNMMPQIAGGLSFGLSGFQFWSQDVGGFLLETNDHLLIRWMQLGVFMSHVRIHGLGKRELYEFEPQTMEICREQCDWAKDSIIALANSGIIKGISENIFDPQRQITYCF